MAESILKLRVDSNEYESKIKRASQGLLQMEQACRSVGGTLAVLEKEDKAFVASLGKMETVSKTARGSLGELTAAFTDLSMQYKRLTDEEKKGDFGTALKHSLDELKGRINDTKKDLADIDKELNGATQATGDFSGVLGQLGSKLGINAELMGLMTTGTMGYVAAAGAAITATIAATKAWADYNEELSKQMQITTVTTGLSGGDANKLRDAADAMAKVYGVDFREVINAANILMTQFGQTSDRSIQLLRDGMQGMIAGDGPKMLNMIQQFAPAFRDAGISADQLVAIIHNSEGGLFSEQNMNAILMGIKNIRLMTKSTSDALAQLGLDGEEMSKRMSEGSMTVFEALEQVAVAIEGAKSGSQEAGQVMQQVFGRQGAMQGMKLGRAIAELNTNLEQTKKQTGELGKSFAALETANERLNESIRNATGWDEMEQKIKNVEAVFVSAVAMAVGAIGKVRNSLYDLTGIDVFDKLASDVLTMLGPVGQLLDQLRQIAGINITPQNNSTTYNRDTFKNPLGGVINKVAPTSTYEDKPKPNQQTSPPKTTPPKTPKTPKVDTDREVTIQQQIAALEKEAFTASEERRKEIAVTIQELDKELARQQQIRDALHGQNQETKDLVATQKKVADARTEASTAKTDNSLKDYYAALNKLKTLGADLTPKTLELSVKADTSEAMKKLHDVEGVKLDEKTMTVAAETQEAVQKMKELDGITLNPKTVDVMPNIVKSVWNALPEELKQSMQKVEVPFSFTTANLDAFIAKLKQDVAKADVGSELSVKLNAQLTDATTLANLMQTAIKNGIDVAQFNPQELWSKIFGDNPGDYIGDSTWQTIVDKINEYMNDHPIELDFTTGSVKTKGKTTDTKPKEASITKEVGQIASGIGQVVNGIDSLGVEIPEGLKNVINGVQTVTSILGGIATTVLAIEALAGADLLTPFAIGGVVKAAGGYKVPGNRMSGDQVPALLNSGETVLTRAQAGVIDTLLSDANRGGGEAQPYVTGEKIWMGVNNFLRRSGRGEIVTSRR